MLRGLFPGDPLSVAVFCRNNLVEKPFFKIINNGNTHFYVGNILGIFLVIRGNFIFLENIFQ